MRVAFQSPSSPGKFLARFALRTAFFRGCLIARSHRRMQVLASKEFRAPVLKYDNASFFFMRDSNL
jgi:hypothetical protein